MTFKILLCSNFMLNTQVLTPLSKKKKKKVVQVLAIDNMEKYLLHISEKNV